MSEPEFERSYLEIPPKTIFKETLPDAQKGQFTSPPLKEEALPKKVIEESYPIQEKFDEKLNTGLDATPPGWKKINKNDSEESTKEQNFPLDSNQTTDQSYPEKIHIDPKEWQTTDNQSSVTNKPNDYTSSVTQNKFSPREDLTMSWNSWKKRAESKDDNLKEPPVTQTIKEPSPYPSEALETKRRFEINPHIEPETKKGLYEKLQESINRLRESRLKIRKAEHNISEVQKINFQTEELLKKIIDFLNKQSNKEDFRL